MTNKETAKLVGRDVTGYVLSDDNETLRLSFRDGGTEELRTESECCSITWIESIDTPEYLNGVIQEIENIDMPDRGNIATQKRESVDEVKYYGLKITTDKGIAVIDYRNDSNGYYGGDLILATPSKSGNRLTKEDPC